MHKDDKERWEREKEGTDEARKGIKAKNAVSLHDAAAAVDDDEHCFLPFSLYSPVESMMMTKEWLRIRCEQSSNPNRVRIKLYYFSTKYIDDDDQILFPQNTLMMMSCQ